MSLKLSSCWPSSLVALSLRATRPSHMSRMMPMNSRLTAKSKRPLAAAHIEPKPMARQANVKALGAA